MSREHALPLNVSDQTPEPLRRVEPNGRLATDQSRAGAAWHSRGRLLTLVVISASGLGACSSDTAKGNPGTDDSSVLDSNSATDDSSPIDMAVAEVSPDSMPATEASNEAGQEVAMDTPSGDVLVDGTSDGSDANEGSIDAASPLSPLAQKGLTIAPFPLDVSALTVAQQEQIGTGSYLVNALGDCNDCHSAPQAAGPPKYLGGGTPFALDGAGHKVFGRNLTSDPTTGLTLTEAQFVETMRTGKDFRATGTEALLVMPWSTYRWMSTSDIKAIYAYLAKVPGFTNPVPPDSKGPAGAAQPTPFPASSSDGDLARAIPAETTSDPGWSQRGIAVQPLADPTAYAALTADQKATYGRGSYLVNAIAGCSDCHTNPDRNYLLPDPKINTASFLTGGRVFTVPPGLNAIIHQTRSMSADILGATNGFLMDFGTFKSFFQSPQVSAWPMPSSSYAKLLDADVTAIYQYLSVQNKIIGTKDKATQKRAVYCAAMADCTGTGETCNLATHECIGAVCALDKDCAACQTCATLKCAAPLATSTCLTTGI